MSPNVGGFDKTLRLVVGVALLSLFFFADGSTKWWGLLGLVPIGTALLNFCPLYPILGINTCGAKKA